MITGEVEAVDRKQKIRDRYKGVDISELEVIPAKIIEDLETSSVIRRVAAYIRVSTDNDEQTSSYELQKNYYTDYIQAQPGWVFVGIYADEGISGTSLEHRKGMQQLIEDCKAGNMQKTEQKTEQQAGLGMSFCEEEGRITVFRKTLEALEWPSHYRFLYNRKMKQIAVQACGAEESGAHRVGKPDESNSGEIKCMALVRMIYGDSGWDKKMSYRLIGRAFPQQRLVSFKITDAMQIENGRVLTEM